MSFKWLDNFHSDMEKPTNYAEKTLAAYKLGMKARGSIAGVRVERDKDGCEACLAIDETAVFHPDEAPHVPLPACDKAGTCGCVYRPVMTYELSDGA